MSDEIFKDAPAWNGNHLAYFRLKLPSLLPKDVRYALYLDVDMLVVSDIRELFSIDLEDNYAGVVSEIDAWRLKGMKAKNSQHTDIIFDTNYFNSGFLLFNLESVRKINFWERAIYLLQNYIPDIVDQCIINEIFKGNILKLSHAYNSMITIHNMYPISYCNDENKYFDTNYTRQELKDAMLNPKIYHYNLRNKPWSNQDSKWFWEYCGLHTNWRRTKYIITFWWENALQTPIYKDEFKTLKAGLKDNETIIPFLVLKDIILKEQECNLESKLNTLKRKIRKRDRIYITLFLTTFIAFIVAIISK